MPDQRLAASASFPAESAAADGTGLRLPAALVEALFRAAEVPDEWGLQPARFAQALDRSAAQRFGQAGASPAKMEEYCNSLRLHDLAFACACGDGDERAWEQFIREYRPELYRAARAIAGESQGRELADSLYAELYGLEERDGRRRSLFDYFHGRSKLSTWMRAILSQRHVDELRRARHTESLDDDLPGDQPAGRTRLETSAPPDPDRERFLALLQAALSGALAALAPRDRLRLQYYYVEELTLAQIGRLVGESEATSSRKLARTRRELRERVDCALRGTGRLSEEQVRLCYEYACTEWPFDLTKVISAGE